MIGALFAALGLSEAVSTDELRPSPHIAAYYQTWSAKPDRPRAWTRLSSACPSA